MSATERQTSTANAFRATIAQRKHAKIVGETVDADGAIVFTVCGLAFETARRTLSGCSHVRMGTVKGKPTVIVGR